MDAGNNIIRIADISRRLRSNANGTKISPWKKRSTISAEQELGGTAAGFAFKLGLS